MIRHVKLAKINQINLVRVVLQMEDIHITIKYCQHVLIHARSVIMKLIINAWHVQKLVLHVQMKIIVRGVQVTEIIHTILQILIFVQQIVVLAISMINIIVSYVILRVILA